MLRRISRIMSVAIFTIAITLTSLPAGATHYVTEGWTGSVDQQHDFDFEFGAWKARIRMQPHPLTESAEWVDYSGTSVVRKVWDGRANLGELEASSKNKHIEALSLRIFDQQAQTWRIYFANAKGGLSAVAMVGRFDYGRGFFYGTATIDGKPTRIRFVFSNVTLASFDFEQSFSRDDGKTWNPNWIATFTK